MKQTDLEPEDVRDLRAIREAIANLSVFLTVGLTDLEVLLTTHGEMLKELLIAQGIDPDELDKALKERAIEWREVAKKALESRWTALVRDQAVPVDSGTRKD